MSAPLGLYAATVSPFAITASGPRLTVLKSGSSPAITVLLSVMSNERKKASVRLAAAAIRLPMPPLPDAESEFPPAVFSFGISSAFSAAPAAAPPPSAAASPCPAKGKPTAAVMAAFSPIFPCAAAIAGMLLSSIRSALSDVLAEIPMYAAVTAATAANAAIAPAPLILFISIITVLYFFIAFILPVYRCYYIYYPATDFIRKSELFLIIGL